MSVFFSGIAQLRTYFSQPVIYNFQRRIFLAVMLGWLSGCTANVYFHPPEEMYLVQPEMAVKKDHQS
ncbi:hypothetical protein HUF18_07000 [Thalassolituus sp. ST750PaO-4]|uniref:hypothetical protein n=1 Tax=Thalassolituus sp. ST750PaO-4 TaxID=2742965 RepID=UPI000C3D8092|nr:hypothetical protein [Thalassolituus sp. ST750PaO-4]MCA6059522.1 hypothetical protein [Thalassolituus sp. ST750PaO-4]PIQ39868.1 MAG: hypothetical protein COW58_09240 [Thalassolituus sp. CG17_big_fil_post_rev_8_21_14_2_50_53_8]